MLLSKKVDKEINGKNDFKNIIRERLTSLNKNIILLKKNSSFSNIKESSEISREKNKYLEEIEEIQELLTL
jgi:hypothetical protein